MRMNILLMHNALCCHAQNKAYQNLASSLEDVQKLQQEKKQYITTIHHLQRPFQEEKSTCKCLLNPWTLQAVFILFFF